MSSCRDVDTTRLAFSATVFGSSDGLTPSSNPVEKVAKDRRSRVGVEEERLTRATALAMVAKVTCIVEEARVRCLASWRVGFKWPCAEATIRSR